MANALLEFGTEPSEEKDVKPSISIAMVIDNIDFRGEARVQVRYPWMPGIEPWARVSSPSAGLARGFYFMPQIGDEVLVAFPLGDVREPVVIGGLWSTIDRPPVLSPPTDPIMKRFIRTPTGNQIEFDELEQKISITTVTQHAITMDPTGVTISAIGGIQGSITLGTDGSVTIRAMESLKLMASTVEIQGGSVSITGVANTSVRSGGQCNITGSVVAIN